MTKKLKKLTNQEWEFLESINHFLTNFVPESMHQALLFGDFDVIISHIQPIYDSLESGINALGLNAHNVTDSNLFSHEKAAKPKTETPPETEKTE